MNSYSFNSRSKERIETIELAIIDYGRFRILWFAHVWDLCLSYILSENMYNKGGKWMDNEITTTVIIGDTTGHQTLELTQDETMSQIESHNSSWVYADGVMVTPEQIAQADWSTVGRVTIMPGLVGGN